MRKILKNHQDTFFVITILFFILGIINISLSIIGILCFVIPFIQYYIYKEKVWCKYHCPRAGLFNKLLRKISLKKKIPKLFTTRRVKEIVVIYFAINIFFAIMSTIMVTVGRIEPIDYVRFLIIFKAPFTLPQLLSLHAPDALLHFGYRIYSMMFTSIAIGLILGFVYKPRTWCIICPIQTLTTKINITS